MTSQLLNGLSTKLQTNAKYTADWDPRTPYNVIRRAYQFQDIKVDMDLSKLSEEDKYYQNLILEENVKLHKAILSQPEGATSYVVRGIPDIEAEAPAGQKVVVQVAEEFVNILNQVGSNPRLWVVGTFIGGRWEEEEEPRDLVLPQRKFRRRTECSSLVTKPFVEIVKFDEETLRQYGDGVEIRFEFNISVEWDRPHRPLHLDSKEITQSLFEDDGSKDCTLEAVDGEVKCHGFVLSARSEVFKRMLSPETGMIEATSGRIDFQEMTHQCLELFVGLLYGIEMDSSSLSCEIIVQLFEAAEKYDIPCLQETLRKVLMGKWQDWYTPDSILELFGFVNNSQTEAGTLLKDHVLQVMSRMAPKIRQCDRYKGLTKPEVETVLWALFESKKG